MPLGREQSPPKREQRLPDGEPVGPGEESDPEAGEPGPLDGEHRGFQDPEDTVGENQRLEHRNEVLSATEQSPESSDQGALGTGGRLPERGESSPRRNQVPAGEHQGPAASGASHPAGGAGPEEGRECAGDGGAGSVEGGAGPSRGEQGPPRRKQCPARGGKSPSGRDEGAGAVEQDSSGAREQPRWLGRCPVRT